MTTLLRNICATLIAFVPLAVDANSLEDLFSGQRLIYELKNDNVAHALTLSSLKKIDGVWSAEREELITGRLVRRTFEISRPYNLETAWQEVQNRFPQSSSSLVFECKGLACGSSNAWANERFGVKQLYGLGLSQHYQVWQTQLENRDVFAAVYMVQRGNKRVYFQLDMLFPTGDSRSLVPTEEVVARVFYRDNQIEVRGLNFSEGDIAIDRKYLESFARAFNQQPFRTLVVVGHDSFPGTEDEQLQRSENYAQSVVDALVELGVQAKRLEAKGVGALAPDPQGKPAKVVVLIKRR